MRGQPNCGPRFRLTGLFSYYHFALSPVVSVRDLPEDILREIFRFQGVTKSSLPVCRKWYQLCCSNKVSKYKAFIIRAQSFRPLTGKGRRGGGADSVEDLCRVVSNRTQYSKDITFQDCSLQGTNKGFSFLVKFATALIGTPKNSQEYALRIDYFGCFGCC